MHFDPERAPDQVPLELLLTESCRTEQEDMADALEHFAKSVRPPENPWSLAKRESPRRERPEEEAEEILSALGRAAQEGVRDWIASPEPRGRRAETLEQAFQKSMSSPLAHLLAEETQEDEEAADAPPSSAGSSFARQISESRKLLERALAVHPDRIFAKRFREAAEEFAIA